MGRMPSSMVELTLRSNLWYTFDGRLLRGLEDWRLGKTKSQQCLLRFSDILTYVA